MPRIPRVLVDDGYYHVITRGNDRRKLFRYKQDYLCFSLYEHIVDTAFRIR